MKKEWLQNKAVILTILMVLLFAAAVSMAANKMLTDLTALPSGSWATTDLIPIVDLSANESKKTSIGDFDLRYLVRTDVISVVSGGTGLSSLGSSDKLLGVNNAGSSLEYKALAAGDGISITSAPGVVSVSLSGSIAQNLSFGGNKITNLGEPTTPSGAATKNYVDSAVPSMSVPLTVSGVSSGDILYASGANSIARLAIGTTGKVLTVSGSGFPVWASSSGGGGSYTAPTYQSFPTVTSGTYTTPGGVLYLKVRMVGGGGGGGGSGTSTGGGNGGNGGNTTFGSSLLVANGGAGGVSGGESAGGSYSLGGARGFGVHGQNASGEHYEYTGTGSGKTAMAGGNGGNAPFFGGGGMSRSQNDGFAGVSNTGGGGGSGGGNIVANFWTGPGGGSGGFVEATIISPSATYSYSVGAGGTAGTAGTNGFAGGAGGSGYIIVEEFYQ